MMRALYFLLIRFHFTGRAPPYYGAAMPAATMAVPAFRRTAPPSLAAMARCRRFRYA